MQICNEYKVTQNYDKEWLYDQQIPILAIMKKT